MAAGLYPGVSTSCLLSGKGDWSTNTEYVECDVVSSNGENYVCNTPHTSPASVFGEDVANWDLLSLKGDKGDPGEEGPQGIPGEDGAPGTSSWIDDPGFVTTSSRVGIGAEARLGLQVSNYAENYPASTGNSQNGAVRLNALDEDGCMDFGTASGGHGWIQMSHKYDLSTNYNLLLNPNGGNVGIGLGAHSPNEPLEIGGSGRLFIGDGGGANRTGLLIDAKENGNYVRLNPYDYQTGSQMNLYIPGNVGIGTTSPGANLEVAGSVKITGGNPGVNKVLTSDANGFASWVDTSVIPTVISTNGRIWMDRNLGALRVATKSADPDAYGSLYQWGRRGDGHEYRTSPTTTTRSDNPSATTGIFILVSDPNTDWKITPDDTLWASESSSSNPCPAGFRLPTKTEYETELISWGVDNLNAAGAFASPLKLVVAGHRNSSYGYVSGAGTYGSYWSSTVDDTSSYSLYLSSSANMDSTWRSNGFSVRCIKD